MNSLAAAPASVFELVARDGGLSDYAQLTESQKHDLGRKLGVVEMLRRAGHGGKGAIVATQARLLNTSPQAIHLWWQAYRKGGWRALVDGRRTGKTGRAALPQITANWITDQILQCQRADAVQEVHRQVMDRWNLWRRTGDPQWQIPGYLTPPPDAGKGHPAGMSYETFRRCQPTDYQAKLARQGTIAAYRDLPSILSTCVGSKYLEYVFFDDEKPDVNVRVPGFDRPMVPLCFHALDRLTRYPFRPHVRLRWYDTDEQTHRTLTQKEFVWYVIYLLCNEGYRTDEAGTTYIQEHGTAKTWANKSLTTPHGHHSFEDALLAITEGHCKMDASGIFNKPAFKELLYGPQASGNPRFKAPIESSFHLWRTYSQMLIGQTGRTFELGPEENHGITQYETRLLKLSRDWPEHLRDAVQSNYLTGVEFGTLAECIREALAGRTDHQFEGWNANNFVEPVWRWAEDPVGMWRPRKELASLPQHLREHALHQQKSDPLLSAVLPWSPAVAKACLQHDPAVAKLRFEDAILLLPTSWAKPVKVRDRHELHLTEDLLPGQELIYLPELTTPRGRTEYLQPGDEVMIYLNPLMPDTVLCCDMSFAFIGTLTRSVRIGRDNDQVEAMFRQRARLKGHLEAPVRRALQPTADRRAAVREINDDLIAQARDVTPPAPPKPARVPAYVDPLAASLVPALAAEPEADPFA